MPQHANWHAAKIISAGIKLIIAHISSKWARRGRQFAGA
jgi:hypothetical protein